MSEKELPIPCEKLSRIYTKHVKTCSTCKKYAKAFAEMILKND